MRKFLAYNLAVFGFSQIPRQKLLLALGIFLVLSLALFGRSVFHEFVLWDDDTHIYENPHLSSPNLEKVGNFWKEPYANLYIPVTYTLWSALSFFSFNPRGNSPIERMDPSLFHLVNLLLHTLNALLVLVLLQLLLRPYVENEEALFLPCLMGSFLFLIHPLQVEAVAWATGLKDLLAGFFGLLASISYTLYLGYEKKLSLKKRGKPSFQLVKGPRCQLGFAFLFFLLAILSKPSAVSLIPMFFLIARVLRKVSYPKLCLQLLPAILITVPIIMLTRGAQTQVIRYPTPLWLRIPVALDTICFYLQKIILPLGLGPDYGHSPQVITELWWFPISASMGAILLLLAWRKSKDWTLFSFAFGLFLVGLVPNLGLIPFAYQNFSTVADHYGYFAMVGLSLGLAAVLIKAPERVFLKVSLGAVFLGLGILSFIQVGTWKNTFTLFEHGLEVNPRSWAAHTDLGLALERKGRSKEAIIQFKESLKIRPEDEDAENNLGASLISLKRYQEVIDHYTGLLDRHPNYFGVLLNLGCALEKLGRDEEATMAFEKAVKIKPSIYQAQFNLGLLLQKQGRLEEALERFEETLRLNPYLTLAKEYLESTQRMLKNQAAL